MKLLTQKLQLRQEVITLQTLNVFHCLFIVFLYNSFSGIIVLSISCFFDIRNNGNTFPSKQADLTQKSTLI